MLKMAVSDMYLVLIFLRPCGDTPRYISNLHLSKDNPLAIPGSVAKLHNV